MLTLGPANTRKYLRVETMSVCAMTSPSVSGRYCMLSQHEYEKLSTWTCHVHETERHLLHPRRRQRRNCMQRKHVKKAQGALQTTISLMTANCNTRLTHPLLSLPHRPSMSPPPLDLLQPPSRLPFSLFSLPLLSCSRQALPFFFSDLFFLEGRDLNEKYGVRRPCQPGERCL